MSQRMANIIKIIKPTQENEGSTTADDYKSFSRTQLPVHLKWQQEESQQTS